MSRAQDVLRKLGPLYCLIRWTYRFAVAVGSVRVDISSIRETYVLLRGGQDLPPGNYKFYRNFFDGLSVRERDTGRKHLFIDVGANAGWFAKTVLRFAPTAQIVSYEPLQSQHAFLDEIHRRHPGFAYLPVALGETVGQLVLSELGSSGLSSFKPLSDSYRYSDRFDARIVNKYAVEVRRLDDEIPRILASVDEETDLVLKIDTQGFEYEVLCGASAALGSGRIRYVLIELMTIQKYEGARLYEELMTILHGHGFKLWDFNTQHYETVSHQMSEFDAIFVLDA